LDYNWANKVAKINMLDDHSSPDNGPNRDPNPNIDALIAALEGQLDHKWEYDPTIIGEEVFLEIGTALPFDPEADPDLPDFMVEAVLGKSEYSSDEGKVVHDDETEDEPRTLVTIGVERELVLVKSMIKIGEDDFIADPDGEEREALIVRKVCIETTEVADPADHGNQMKAAQKMLQRKLESLMAKHTADLSLRQALGEDISDIPMSDKYQALANDLKILSDPERFEEYTLRLSKAYMYDSLNAVMIAGRELVIFGLSEPIPLPISLKSSDGDILGNGDVESDVLVFDTDDIQHVKNVIKLLPAKKFLLHALELACKNQSNAASRDGDELI